MNEENANDVPSTPSEDPTVATPTDVAGDAVTASLGQRIGAAFLDCLIVGPVLIIPFLGTLIYIAYMLMRDCLPFLNGQSIGKKILKIRAVTESGQSLSGNWSEGLLRNVPMVIPVMPLVELIVLIVDNGKPGGPRRLGDQWAKTKVVKAG
ncbi:hypothetical protein Rhal01_02646 [Rubritalea halochordaticola]|uniref:RDD domain-containing protein n=1 Tax=Rubritalea halochordaticola TaxID=714537 RepID=A0ABP9V758_9BACT